MKIKVSQIEGAALDWAVLECLPDQVNQTWQGRVMIRDEDLNYVDFAPSANWSQCGPLIEHYQLMIYASILHESGEVMHWVAVDELAHTRRGIIAGTPLAAAMRAIVAAKLGDEVEVPDEVARSQSGGAS